MNEYFLSPILTQINCLNNDNGLLWGTMGHWLEHGTYNHKVVGTSHDLSSFGLSP